MLRAIPLPYACSQGQAPSNELNPNHWLYWGGYKHVYRRVSYWSVDMQPLELTEMANFQIRDLQFRPIGSEVGGTGYLCSKSPLIVYVIAFSAPFQSTRNNVFITITILATR